MEISANYLERFKEKPAAPRNEREELLGKFLERLNPPRLEAGLKPLSHAGLAAKLQGVPTSDLYGFYKSCERAKSFSRLFWHLIKPKV